MTSRPKARTLAASSMKPSIRIAIQRDFDAVALGELGDAAVVMEGHDARHDGLGDAGLARFLNEVEVGVGVEEELGDGAVGAGLHLVGKNCRSRAP